MSTTEPIVETPSWWDREHGGEDGFLVAYFSLEFGVDESLPIYSGGLGVLAGDHLKAASELGRAARRRRARSTATATSASGSTTRAARPRTRSRSIPRRSGSSARRRSRSSSPARTVEAAVWRYDVGRMPLYLLDAPGITDGLYAGDREHRIRQELLVGVGGVRALEALGLRPTVFHMNEGHAAFLALERIRALVEAGVPRDEALERVRATDRLHDAHAGARGQRGLRARARAPLRRRARRPLRARRGGAARARPLRRRRPPRHDAARAAPLGARQRGLGAPRRGRARDVGRPIDTPIGHVTNGVHPGTWISPELDELMRDGGRPPRSGGVGRPRRPRARRDPGASTSSASAG